jgi:putative ABC transport system permease protein
VLPERLAILPRLALADLRHEWGMALCYVAALAAILTPLLVLDGLRAGVIAGLTDQLRSNPSKLRINLPGTLQLNTETIAAIAALEGVGYLEPMSRSIAARLLIEGPQAAVETVDLLPSGSGDPLLRGEVASLAPDQIALSADLAQRFGVGPGDRVTGRARRAGKWPARLDLTFQIVATLPGDFLVGRQALVAPGVADQLEAFRDEYELPAHGIDGRSLEERPVRYENLRIYAADLESVEPLAAALRSSFGLQVRAAEDEVRRIQALDRNLGAVFSLIGVVAGAGFVTALAASLWGNVERKRRALGILRLMGAARLGLVAFPLTHGLAIAALGFGLAAGAAAVVAGVINARFADAESGLGAVCTLVPSHLMLALAVTLLAAVGAALAGGIKASRLDPTEGMRESS